MVSVQHTGDNRKIDDVLQEVRALTGVVPVIDPRLVSFVTTTRFVLSTIVAIFAGLAICGCVLDLPVLRNSTPWGRLITANTAVCLFLGAMAILGAGKKPLFLLVAGMIITFVGGITVCEWITNWNCGIDQILLSDKHALQGFAPGRPSMVTGLLLAFLGMSMMTRYFARIKLSQCCAFLIVMVGLVSLYGHTFGIEHLLTYGRQQAIPLPVNIGVIFMGFSLLAIRPEIGLTQVVISPNLGGRVMRILLPVVLLGPMLGVFTGMTMVLIVFMSTLLPFFVWLLSWIIDVLDRKNKKALNESLAMREIAEKALVSKKRFVSTISHEVRTPMACVIGLAELLALQDLGPENNVTARAILDSSERLLQFLNNLLDVARLENAKVVLECRYFPIYSVFGETKELIRAEASKKGLSISATFDGSIPEQVCGDELRVRQIIHNLAFNAVRFTQKGSIHLNASLLKRMPGKIIIRFTVSDTGPGLTPEEQNRIFSPFEQVQDNTACVHGGSGLSLSIARGLVECMHGEIGVDSQPGKGSDFWCEIPFLDENCKL